MSLIRTIDQFCAHVRVQATGTQLVNLAPDLRLVERQHVRPLLGPALHNELSALGDDDLAAALAAGSPTGELLLLVQEALANLALLEYLALKQLLVNDAGVFLLAGGKSPFKWQVDDLRESLRRKGYNALEAVLEYLDEHAADFPAWATSAAATEARRLLLATAADFSRHYDIGGSRLTYQALLATLRKVERFDLLPVVGADYLAELRAQLVAGQVSADNQLVLDEYLRPALAHLVVAKAAPEVGLTLNGAALELNVYRFDPSNAKEADASLDQLLANKVSQAQRDGLVFLQQLRRFLNISASLTRFATYYASSAYVAPTAPRPVITTPVASPTYRFF